MNTVAVYLQPPNKPKLRQLVGHITMGYKPDETDYRRWGVEPTNVIEAKMMRVVGQRCWVVVADD